MSKRIEIVGKQFHHWTVLKYEYNHQNHSFYKCKCSCGNEKTVSGNYLRSGKSKSCGCRIGDIQKNKSIERKNKYPFIDKINSIHHGMIYRCYYKFGLHYGSYGGRGIIVCEEWHDKKKFYEWAIKGYKEGLTLDRINNDGIYEKSNCQWITQKENCNKTRRTKYYVLFGEKITTSQLADKTGQSYRKIGYLLKKNSAEEIFNKLNKGI